MTRQPRTNSARDEDRGSVVLELRWRSPTLPPDEDPDCPPVRATLSYVVGLLAVAGTVAWLAVPFVQ